MFEALEGRQLYSASAGLELIGLSSQTVPAGQANPDNVGATASVIQRSGVRDPVVAFLPFEFNPSAPFATATSLIHKVLPSLPGTLTMDVYLQWFPHDAPGQAAQTAFWNSADNPATVQAGFVNRVHQADLFCNSAISWATSAGLSPSRLQFVYIPVLEDTCASKTEFANLMTRMSQKEAADGIQVAVRRSCLVGNSSEAHPFRVAGATLELHGAWSDVSKLVDANAQPLLRAGDTWSPDGESEDYIVGGSFLSDEKKALGAGVNVMAWDASFNGLPYQRDNEPDRLVNLFTPAVQSMSTSALSKGG